VEARGGNDDEKKETDRAVGAKNDTDNRRNRRNHNSAKNPVRSERARRKAKKNEFKNAPEKCKTKCKAADGGAAPGRIDENAAIAIRSGD
jgi:hypothetical protein